MDSLPRDKGYNAAICALEMSLLDLLGKKQDASITGYFPRDFSCNEITYGATIPLAGKPRATEISRLARKMQINKLRVKMGRNFEKNGQAAETVRSVFGDDCDLRIDINGAWDRELALKHIDLIKEYSIKVVEQPMTPADPGIADFASAVQPYGTILMADESACSLAEVKTAIEKSCYKMINVRLSKCGGFRNSLRIIDWLRSNRLPFQIGCQLGESGVLSAAGRALGLLCRDARYYDGSYDAFLLKENLTLKHVSFGPGGKAGPLDGPGLGVEVSSRSLNRLSDASSTITIPRS